MACAALTPWRGMRRGNRGGEWWNGFGFSCGWTRLRNGPFRAAIRAVSRCKMGRFTAQNGPFCNALCISAVWCVDKSVPIGGMRCMRGRVQACCRCLALTERFVPIYAAIAFVWKSCAVSVLSCKFVCTKIIMRMELTKYNNPRKHRTVQAARFW